MVPFSHHSRNACAQQAAASPRPIVIMGGGWCYPPRVIDTPTMMVVAEGDDLSQWDAEIAAFDQIASNDKKLFC